MNTKPTLPEGETSEPPADEAGSSSRALFGVWSTIETAPRDGTIVDLWCGDARYADCWWHTFKNGVGDWAVAEKANGDIMCLVGPTHWMPLPLPPNVRALLRARMEGG